MSLQDYLIESEHIFLSFSSKRMQVSQMLYTTPTWSKYFLTVWILLYSIYGTLDSVCRSSNMLNPQISNPKTWNFNELNIFVSKTIVNADFGLQVTSIRMVYPDGLSGWSMVWASTFGIPVSLHIVL